MIDQQHDLHHSRGECRDGKHQEAAVAFEQGRARILGDALAHDRADPKIVTHGPSKSYVMFTACA